jgi:hypothetical protein
MGGCLAAFCDYLTALFAFFAPLRCGRPVCWSWLLRGCLLPACCLPLAACCSPFCCFAACWLARCLPLAASCLLLLAASSLQLAACSSQYYFLLAVGCLLACCLLPLACCLRPAAAWSLLLAACGLVQGLPSRQPAPRNLKKCGPGFETENWALWRLCSRCHKPFCPQG